MSSLYGKKPDGNGMASQPHVLEDRITKEERFAKNKSSVSPNNSSMQYMHETAWPARPMELERCLRKMNPLVS